MSITTLGNSSLGQELNQHLNQWLLDLQADKAASTIARYQSGVQNFLNWYDQIEGRPATLNDLNPISLAGYRAALQKKAKTSSVNTILAALRAWCKWLTQAGLVEEDPASRLKMVKRQAGAAPKSLTSNQVNALLREAGRGGRYVKRDLAIIMLLLQTGIRIGECQQLTFADVEFGEKTGRLTVRAGKGNKMRVVPLNSSARQALADHLAPALGVEPSLKAVAGAWNSAGGATPLWRSERGGQISLLGIERAVTRVLTACQQRGQLPAGVTAHSLRHTFATKYLASNQGDLVGLAELLGHSSLDTTRIYLRQTEDEIARRVEGMDLNAYH